MTDLILLIQSNEMSAKTWLERIPQNNITQHVVHTKSSAEALAFLYDDDSTAPCLIILDMEMLHADLVLKRIKTDPLKAIIPVVALIADERKKYTDEAYSLGADGYIVSAVDYSEYLQELEKLQFYWSDLSRLAFPTRPSPTVPASADRDIRMEQIKHDFIMLVQPDDQNSKRYAESLREQLILIGIKQFRSGREALNYLFGGPTWLPRFILLDMSLPNDDLAEFFARMKGDNGKKQVPIVALVPDMTNKFIREAHAKGANSYLVKALDNVEHRVNIERLNFYWGNPDQLPQ